jgi:hypothetical protein
MKKCSNAPGRPGLAVIAKSADAIATETGDPVSTDGFGVSAYVGLDGRHERVHQ